MSTTYTGVGGSVTQSTSPTITVPSDGDSLAVTSVNTPLDKLMDYIALIFGGAFTGQTSSTPGLSGTGGASAQGGKFTAGGGASPVKGEINLVPTTNAPSSADNGDLWATSAGILGTKLNGNIRTVALLEAATQTFSSNLTFTGASLQIPKAWGIIRADAAGATTLIKTYNVTSASWSTSTFTVNLTTALADANAMVIAQYVVSGTLTNQAVNPGATTTAVTVSKANFSNALVNWVANEFLAFIVMD